MPRYLILLAVLVLSHRCLAAARVVGGGGDGILRADDQALCDVSARHVCGAEAGQCKCPKDTVCEEEKYIPPAQRCMPSTLSLTFFGYEWTLDWDKAVTARHLDSGKTYSLGAFAKFQYDKHRSFWVYSGGDGALCGGARAAARVFYNNNPWVKAALPFIKKIEEEPQCLFKIYVEGPHYY